jgi:hypothetical protein
MPQMPPGFVPDVAKPSGFVPDGFVPDTPDFRASNAKDDQGSALVRGLSNVYEKSPCRSGQGSRPES